MGRKRADWGDYLPPGPIPRDSMLFFGAQVGHSPARESQTPDESRGHVAHPVTGHVIPKQRCRDCGGYLVEGHADPLKVDSEVVWACGSCQRTHWDGSKQLERTGLPVRDTDVDVRDAERRTEVAIKGPEQHAVLTRRQKRARKFGSKT